jgi:hypothetical protein
MFRQVLERVRASAAFSFRVRRCVSEISWRQPLKSHDVEMIDFEGTKMILKVDGQVYRVNLPSISSRLTKAKDAARRSYSVSPSGYGVHWPDIDEDLTIDGLIAAAHPARPKTSEAPLLLKEQPQHNL